MLQTMAGRGHIDPSSTNLKLVYDVTPKELGSYEPSANEFANKSFGYKGYAHGQFVSPRQPARDHRSLEYEERQNNFGKTQHFSPEKPKIYENHHGIQYSDGIPLANQEPRRIGNTLHSKTSAELRKYDNVRQEAEDDIQKFKAEQLQRKRAEQEQKKKDFAMLENYNPFGKSGAGAPRKNSGNQRKVFTEEDLSRQAPQEGGGNRDNFNDYFGQPGHGAPIKTSSGKVLTNIPGDRSIRFGMNPTQKTVKQVIDPYRYHADHQTAEQMKETYQKQMKDNALMNEEARMKERRLDLEMMKFDPYGKPGAGAPNERNERRRRTHSDELGLQYLYTQQDKKGNRDSYDPWGKGYGVPMRDGQGNVERHAFTRDVDGGIVTTNPVSKSEASIDMGQQWAGAPRKTNSGNVNAKFKNTMNYNLLGAEDAKITELYPSKRDVYDPFGKPGAGAPKKDGDGSIKTKVNGSLRHETLSGDQQKRTLAKQEYNNELKRGMAEQQQIREANMRYEKAPIGEMASVMKDYQVGNPKRDRATGLLANQHLPSTDVTQEKTNTRPLKNAHTQEYHNELESEAHRRYVNRRLDKLRELQLAEQHYKTNDGTWGKPGAGAPNTQYKKANLDSSLFHPQQSEPAYQKVSEDGKIETSPRNNNFVKSTISSKHSNHFENEIDIQHRLPRRDYKVAAPYATI